MVSFCDAVVMELKFADSEATLKDIIDKSFIEYRNINHNIHNEAKYTLNMIVTLRSEASSKDISENMLKNLKVAIKIFKSYHIKSYK